MGQLMPGRTLHELRAEALGLCEPERAELAHDLIASLDAPPDSDASRLWEAELLRRVAEVRAGTATLIDRDELRRLLEARRIRNV